MKTFYIEICNASTELEEKKICEEYKKPYKIVRKCINNAMKMHMASSSNSKEEFHAMIVQELNSKDL